MAQGSRYWLCVRPPLSHAAVCILTPAMCASPAQCSGTLDVVCYPFLPLMSSVGVTHFLPEEHRRDLEQVDGHLPAHRLQVASCAHILEGLLQGQNSWVAITFSQYFLHIFPLLFGRESFFWAACWVMFFSLDFGGHTRWTPCFLLPVRWGLWIPLLSSGSPRAASPVFSSNLGLGGRVFGLTPGSTVLFFLGFMLVISLCVFQFVHAFWLRMVYC